MERLKQHVTMQKNQEKQNGIRLKWLYRGIIPFIVVLCALLILIALYIDRSFITLEHATEQYIAASRDCADMQAGSDYLTDRARTFIVTGDITGAEAYFNEMDVTRRRDIAVQSMEDILSGTDTVKHLRTALDFSNRLSEIEKYAMALAARGLSIELGTLPDALQAVILEAEDEALSQPEQRVKAREMVFDTTYQTYKENIRENISLCELGLIQETETAQQKGTIRLERMLILLTVLVALVFAGAIAIAVLNQRLVMDPINAFVQAIQENKPVEEKGARELRMMSRSYNSSLSQTQQFQKELSFRADHDALTGILNRGGFENARQATRGRAQALIIVDVDRFKQFNDTYGHDMGDQILKKVADALAANFREEDYVCRYGGDEFIVIMVHANSSMRSLVQDKIDKIRAALRDVSDGLPFITISVGVAFSDRPNPTDDILKDADTALYITKENGNDGCTFYGDKIKENDQMLSIDTLKDFGANVSEGLDRCLNNEAFYLRLVKTAANDQNFERLEEAARKGDLPAAFEAAHALKGVMANLSLTPILTPVSEMTELLRAGKEMDYGSYLKQIDDARKDLLSLCKA